MRAEAEGRGEGGEVEGKVQAKTLDHEDDDHGGTVLFWSCILQLTALRESCGCRVLKGWPSCFTPPDSPLYVKQVTPVVDKIVLPLKSELFVFMILILYE